MLSIVLVKSFLHWHKQSGLQIIFLNWWIENQKELACQTLTTWILNKTQTFTVNIEIITSSKHQSITNAYHLVKALINMFFLRMVNLFLSLIFNLASWRINKNILQKVLLLTIHQSLFIDSNSTAQKLEGVVWLGEMLCDGRYLKNVWFCEKKNWW